MTEIKQPKIRFKGHINDWEQRKFSNIVNRVSQQSNDSNLPKVEFEDIISGEGRLNKDISNKFDGRKGTVFEPEFILYGKLRPYLKNWLFPNFKGIALGDFWVFEPNNSSSIFDYYLIQSDKYQTVANLSSGTKMPRSDWKTVSETEFSIPVNIEEQVKIGKFFKTLDDTIALHQQKLEVTKQFKQTMLKKMFPSNGETTPEIRFKGFTDDWEKCKLKDLCSLSTGKLDANAMTSDGKYSFFTSGEKVYKTDTFAFDGDAILIAGNGNVGLQHTYRGKFNAYQRTYVLMDFKINKEILSNQITLELPKVLRRETRVGVIPYIVKDMLTELPISYPRNVKEQTLISEYFKTLNSNIFNIECRLENLLNLKQTMLKKLYI